MHFEPRRWLSITGRVSIFTVALLLFAWPSVYTDAGTLSGASGLIETPSADSIGEGEFEVAVRAVDGEFVASVLYGPMEHVEIGANTYARGEPLDVGIVIKGVILEEGARQPGVALGFETNRSYVVVSKSLAPGFRGHAGYGFGDLDGLFGGISYALNTTSVSTGGAGMPLTTLMAEYTSSGLGAGVRLLFSPAISAEAALTSDGDLAAGLILRTHF